METNQKELNAAFKQAMEGISAFNQACYELNVKINEMMGK